MKTFQETGIKKLVHDTESEYIREKKATKVLNKKPVTTMWFNRINLL